jgi:hypothetical protein
MPAWLGPVLKAVLPHTGRIIDAVAPAFTRKNVPASLEEIRLLQEQVAELQAAVTQNDANIKTVASQLAETVAGLERSASIAEKAFRRVMLLSVVALGCATIGMALAAFALYVR